MWYLELNLKASSNGTTAITKMPWNLSNMYMGLSVDRLSI